MTGEIPDLLHTIEICTHHHDGGHQNLFTRAIRKHHQPFVLHGLLHVVLFLFFVYVCVCIVCCGFPRETEHKTPHFYILDPLFLGDKKQKKNQPQHSSSSKNDQKGTLRQLFEKMIINV